jgi:hypothetical protein
MAGRQTEKSVAAHSFVLKGQGEAIQKKRRKQKMDQ